MEGLRVGHKLDDFKAEEDYILHAEDISVLENGDLNETDSTLLVNH